MLWRRSVEICWQAHLSGLEDLDPSGVEDKKTLMKKWTEFYFKCNWLNLKNIDCDSLK